MPFYHLVHGGIFPGEREIHGIVHWRPISFITPLELGPRRFKLAGKKQVEIEIMNHDEALLKVNWGRVTLNLECHDLESDYSHEIIDVGKKPIVSYSNTNQDQYRTIVLEEGSELSLFRTSLFVEDIENEKLHWTSSTEGPRLGFV